MDRTIEIPCVRVEQPMGTFFSGRVSARDLLDACKFDFRRIQDRGGYKDFLGIQRELKQSRIKKISKYIDTVDAVFPTAIVLSVDERCVSLNQVGDEFYILKVSEFVDSDNPELKIEFGDIFSIIDGQHRLKSFELAQAKEFDLNVSIFINIDDATEAEIFSTVNLAQTKVNNSLVYDLFSLAKARSPEKTCHTLVVGLDRLEGSPFKGMIKRLGTATEGRFGETLSQATIVRGILPYITNDPLEARDIGKRVGFWEPISAKDANRRIFYAFFREGEDEKILAILMNYFSAVAKRWPNAWYGTGRGNILNRTNGFNALIRFLKPAYLNFTTQPRIVTLEEFYSLFLKVQLNDGDFNKDRFVPGSSGATALYNQLLRETGV